MIVDLREPVARARRNDQNVSNLDLVRHAVPNVRSVVPRPVELDNGPLRRRTPLPVDNIRTQNDRGRSGDDVIDLADLVMFGDRVRVWLVQLPAVDHADADVSLADLDIPHLLIDQPLLHGFLGIGLEFGERDDCARTHVAAWLRVGGIDLFLRRQRTRETRGRDKPDYKIFHMHLLIDEIVLRHHKEFNRARQRSIFKPCTTVKRHYFSSSLSSRFLPPRSRSSHTRAARISAAISQRIALATVAASGAGQGNWLKRS